MGVLRNPCCASVPLSSSSFFHATPRHAAERRAASPIPPSLIFYKASSSPRFEVLAVVMALASLAAAQSFGDFFPGFAAPQSAAAGSGGRSNTGPILFPNTPPGSETSGVVVGASGFGFVPPGGRAGGARGNSASFTSGSFGSDDYL
ncbi:uncharacterized protein LOC113216066 isoform X2 [Frankliniella occidentalis]|uniref:Uncharacterized protein LOC113216066 isoform X2 n=1 Tax=Frankliniella occidentalis TaxID=133901 RepID=A0A9C6X1A9_FRAOC|nr:uncharacterized protein LOC113216066 isoform X2 [Frankliniella occidentalis]